MFNSTNRKVAVSGILTLGYFGGVGAHQVHDVEMLAQMYHDLQLDGEVPE